MPRRLKTYQTSLGFYDLAIAAPSMKAALQGGAEMPQGIERAAVERRARGEETRWETLKGKLEAALRRARES